MATGDIKNNLEKLKLQLKRIKYAEKIDEGELALGHPTVFLPVIHYSLLLYSKRVAKFISDSGFELYAKNDFRFMESVYKLLREFFNYRPSISLNQFFSNGFAERKLLFINDLISVIRAKQNMLAKKASPTKKVVPQYQPKPTAIENNYAQAQVHPNPNKYPLVNQNFNNQPPNHQNQESSNEKAWKAPPQIQQDEAMKQAKYNMMPLQMKEPHQKPPVSVRPQQVPDIHSTQQRDQRVYYSGSIPQQQPRPEEVQTKGPSVQINYEKYIEPHYQSERPNNYSSKSKKYEREREREREEQHAYGIRKFEPQPAQQTSNSELMGIVSAFNESVKQLNHRMGTFQSQVEARLNKIEAEVILLKNKITLLEKNFMQSPQNEDRMNKAKNREYQPVKDFRISDNQPLPSLYSTDNPLLTEHERNSVEYETLKQKEMKDNYFQSITSSIPHFESIENLEHEQKFGSSLQSIDDQIKNRIEQKRFNTDEKLHQPVSGYIRKYESDSPIRINDHVPNSNRNYQNYLPVDYNKNKSRLESAPIHSQRNEGGYTSTQYSDDSNTDDFIQRVTQRFNQTKNLLESLEIQRSKE